MSLFRTVATVTAGALFVCPVFAEPPSAAFKTVDGRMYGEAAHCGNAHRGIQRLRIPLDAGKTIDRSYAQASVACCGGEENRNNDATAIPAGVYMELSGGNQGEWGVFNVRLYVDTNDVDATGKITAWTVQADTYCGPSCAVGKGGCNVNARAWIKQKAATKPPTLAIN
jgi:hypothetical protein